MFAMMTAGVLGQQAGGSYADEVLGDSPIAYWRLEETSGTTVNDETNTYDGTLTGPTLGGAGAVDNSYSFDGSNDYTTNTTLGAFGSSLGSSTIEFWIKTTATAGQFIFGTVNTGTTLILQGIINTGTTTAADFSASSERTAVFLRAETGGNIRKWYTDAGGIPYDGEWHHVVFVTSADPNTALAGQFYCDGKAITTTLVSSGAGMNVADFGFPLTFGARNVRGTIGGYAAVSLDEIALYASELSLAQVRAHYAASGRTPPPDTNPLVFNDTASWTWFHQPTAIYYTDGA